MTQLMLTLQNLKRLMLTFNSFWTFLTNFKILCCLTVFVVSEQVLNDLGGVSAQL